LIPNPDGAANLKTHIAALAGLVAAAGMLASTAYTRETPRTIGYVCPDGERFTVEFLQDHIRLRTGVGIFALRSEAAGSGEKYSDGRTVFWSKGSSARLERPGLDAHTDCKPLANRPA
jgi:membrane-bound inhibitor of C-type lysozyme